MLEPPVVPDHAILASLSAGYRLDGASLAFLPCGADPNAGAYRVTTADGRAYFVKLRLGPFDELAARVPHWLAQQGVAEVMAPLVTSAGQPFLRVDEFTLLLYPFVEGCDAYQATFTDAHWVRLGLALRRIHDAWPPTELAALLHRETWDATWRRRLHQAILRLDRRVYTDPISHEFAAFLRVRRDEVLDLVECTERLAQTLQVAHLPEVLCHTDLHAGNLLICPDGRFYIVDWDSPLLAPRERDLMYPGGGQGFLGHEPDEEEAHFFQGYGPLQPDLRAVAYYRLERVVEDLALFCEQLLAPGQPGPGGSEADRRQALIWARSNFLPGHTLELADHTARRAQSGLKP